MKKGRPKERAILTVAELAELLGCGRNQAYAAVRNGEIQSFKIGKKICIPRLALQKKMDGETAA